MKLWKWFVFSVMIALGVVGCQRNCDVVESVRPETQDVEVSKDGVIKQVETTADASEVSANEILVGSLKITLPESWREDLYYHISYNEDDTSSVISFYEEPDYSDFGSGRLCSVLQIEGNEPDTYRYLPHFDYIGEIICPDGTEYGVVVDYPTDVQPSIEQTKAYSKMYEDIDQLIAGMEPADVAEFYRNSGGLCEYVLPFSDMFELNESDLAGFTKEELQIARNEIYARHGRRFRDRKLQVYFDGCEWYEGCIEPEAFDESVLNTVEKQNIKKLVEYETAK